MKETVPLQKRIFKKFSIEKLKNKWLIKNIMLVSIITAVILGLSVGFLLRSFCVLDKHRIGLFGFPGSIFLRLVKLFIMPLIGFR
jgi:Na+/H+-dicarboxylate symporter